MLRAPSNIHTYTEVFSGDAALPQPQVHQPDATAVDRAAVDASNLELANKLRVARETGEWSELLLPNSQPTRFILRPIPGQVFRHIMDIHESVGSSVLNALLVRAALVDVQNLDSVKVKLANDNEHGLGVVATVDITNYLDQIDYAIVNELAAIVSQRSLTRPK